MMSLKRFFPFLFFVDFLPLPLQQKVLVGNVVLTSVPNLWRFQGFFAGILLDSATDLVEVLNVFLAVLHGLHQPLATHTETDRVVPRHCPEVDFETAHQRSVAVDIEVHFL